MSRTGMLSWLLLAIFMSGAWPDPARAETLWAGVQAHGLLAELNEDWGAATDAGAFIAWRPMSQLAVGLDATCLIPLRTFDDKRTTDLVLRLAPTLWLLSGEDEAWWYLKLGTGVDSLVVNGHWRGEWIVSVAAGLAVAPRELAFHFGFELLGDWAPLADFPVRSIGLGGFVGWWF